MGKVKRSKKGPCPFNMLFTKFNVPHILDMIFFSLDYESFKACLKVCKAWNKLLTSESQVQARFLFREEMWKEEVELYRAAMLGNVEEVTRLLSSGMVDVNCIKGEYHSTPLWVASFMGKKKVVELLLERGADPDETDINGRTPLWVAANSGKTDVVQMLLDGGADPNKTDNHGKTPLWMAATWDNGHKDVVKLLLDRGVDPNTADISGWTPLHLAAKIGHKDVVRLLLDAGADPDKEDQMGETPLFAAARRGHKDTFKIMMEYFRYVKKNSSV